MSSVASHERDAWRAALTATRPAWRRAYLGEAAAPGEQVCAKLAELIAA